MFTMISAKRIQILNVEKYTDLSLIRYFGQQKQKQQKTKMQNIKTHKPANQLKKQKTRKVIFGEIGSRWWSRRTCSHSLLREHQNHN